MGWYMFSSVLRPVRASRDSEILWPWKVRVMKIYSCTLLTGCFQVCNCFCIHLSLCSTGFYFFWCPWMFSSSIQVRPSLWSDQESWFLSGLVKCMLSFTCILSLTAYLCTLILKFFFWCIQAVFNIKVQTEAWCAVPFKLFIYKVSHYFISRGKIQDGGHY